MCLLRVFESCDRVGGAWWWLWMMMRLEGARGMRGRYYSLASFVFQTGTWSSANLSGHVTCTVSAGEKYTASVLSFCLSTIPCAIFYSASPGRCPMQRRLYKVEGPVFFRSHWPAELLSKVSVCHCCFLDQHLSGQSLSPLCFSTNHFLPVFQEQIMGLSVSLLFLNISGLHGFQTFRPHLNYFRLNPCEGIFFKFIWHDFQNSRCGAPPHLFPPVLQLPIVFGVQLTRSHIFSLTETEYDPPNKWCALYALNQHKPWN